MADSINYLVTIKEGKIIACTDDDQLNKNQVGRISSDGLELEAGNWQLKISHRTPGRITATYADPEDNNPRSFYRMLKEGTFSLEVAPTLRAYWKYTVGLLDLMRERFNIHTIAAENPNQQFRGHLCLCEDHGDRSYTCVITDGKVTTALMDDIHDRFNPEDPEDLYFYVGDAVMEVTGAEWAVVCRMSEHPSFGIEREITLYSNHPNLYFLALELDKFLMREERGNFGDYLEEKEEMP